MVPLKGARRSPWGGGSFVGVGGACLGMGGAHRGPCRASYLARTFLQRPSSFRRSATSCLSAAFSFSRNPARMAIWFSFSRRASRDRLAATLFFLRRAQYLSSCSETNKSEKKIIILTIQFGIFHKNYTFIFSKK